jgi:hypothetical protein
MITAIRNSRGKAAITSDRWHIVHSRFTDGTLDHPYVRVILSEHDDPVDCRRELELVRNRIRAERGVVPVARRDAVYVRPPNYKSLTKSRHRRPKVR